MRRKAIFSTSPHINSYPLRHLAVLFPFFHQRLSFISMKISWRKIESGHCFMPKNRSTGEKGVESEKELEIRKAPKTLIFQLGSLRSRARGTEKFRSRFAGSYDTVQSRSFEFQDRQANRQAIVCAGLKKVSTADKTWEGKIFSFH